jgi:hypothetical protein
MIGHRMAQCAVLLGLLICASPLGAQNPPVIQSGNVTPGHIATWATTGVIIDGGQPGGPIFTGSTTVNDFACVGASGTIIDCGLSAVNTNAWTGLQNFNGGATGPTRSPGDNTTNLANTAFVTAATSGLIAGPVTSTVGDIPIFNNTSGTLLKDSGILFPTAPLSNGDVILANTPSSLARGVPPNPFYSSFVASAAVATWTPYNGPDSNTYTDAAWSPELGLFVATAGTSGMVKSSPDGITWTVRTAPSAATWHGVVWAPALKLFVAVGGGSTSSAMTSPDGITWTGRTTPNTNNWDGLVWSPDLNLLVAVGYSGTGNRVMTSPDGVTWTARTSAADNNWSGVAWAPELTLFVTVANSGTGNRVMTSPDGINWTARSVATDRNWDSVVWSPQLRLFVAVSYSGTTDSVMTSPDGINWTLRTTPTTNTWTRVAWSPQLGIFAATGAPTPGTTNVMTSPDGINWTTHTTNNLNWGGISWSPELGVFAAVSWSGGSMLSTSPAQKNVLPQNVNSSWTTYTPTLSCGTGTLTTATATGRTKTIGKTQDVQVQINITTNGTCAGNLQFSIPNAVAASNTYALSGREITNTGKGLSCVNSAPGNTQMNCFQYDGTYPGVTGSSYVVGGVIELN